jgi:N-acyl-D-amino-acid deacylase
MHDIVIRGGTIIDGTGGAAFTGDVAIAGERIADVGGKQGPARREIDATGLLVTPGWVDVHTHYDGQAMWDPLLGPLVLARRHHRDVRQLRRWLCWPCVAAKPPRTAIT